MVEDEDHSAKYYALKTHEDRNETADFKDLAEAAKDSASQSATYALQAKDTAVSAKDDAQDYAEQAQNALTDINIGLASKADKSNTYTKTETDDQINTKLAELVSSAPATLDTLEELANALGDDPNFATTVATQIGNKVDKTSADYIKSASVSGNTLTLTKGNDITVTFADEEYINGDGLDLSNNEFSVHPSTNVTVDSNGVSVVGTGSVASGDTGLISGGIAHTELRPTKDGTWVRGSQTTAVNLEQLEHGVEYSYALLSRQYDSVRKYINGNFYDYQTDDTVAYEKTVPTGAMPYAGLQKVCGKTVVFNQSGKKTHNGGDTLTNYGVTYTWSDGGVTITANGTVQDKTSAVAICLYTPCIVGHKYLLRGCPKQRDTSFYLSCTQISKFQQQTLYYDYGNGSIFQALENDSAAYIIARVNKGETVDNVQFKPQFFDLTLMFGAGNEPSTVAEFEAMFPSSYYSYNAGTLLSAGVTEVVSKDSNNTTLKTYPIPAEVQALDGYGWSCPDHYNYIDYDDKKYVQEVGSRAYASGDESDSTVITDCTTTYYPLTTAVETDISEYLTDDNLINVEAGGTLTFPNKNGTDYQIPVPSEETYMIDLQEAINNG